MLASMLSRYALAYQRGGLAGLQQLVDADESEGRHERLLVRVTNGRAEVIYFAQPPDWRASTWPASTTASHGAPAGSRIANPRRQPARSRHRRPAATA